MRLMATTSEGRHVSTGCSQASRSNARRAITAEHTFDGDYGRLLERAYEKHVEVLASPTGFEPVF